jgi:hypothetical protein
LAPLPPLSADRSSMGRNRECESKEPDSFVARKVAV